MASAAHSRDPSLDAEWEEWKKKFEKTYSPDEEGHRRALWEENKKIIEKHNAEYEQGKTSYTMGLNQFSDMEPSAQDDAEENGPCKGGTGGVLSITLSSMCPAEENADFI